MKNSIIIGGGGHSKVIISMIKKIKNYNIIGYIDNIDKGLIYEIPYLGDDSYFFRTFRNNEVLLIFGIGLITNFDNRMRIIENYHKMNFVFLKVVSPDAVINDDVHISIGTSVMPGVIVNCSSKIGKFSILNTRSSIDHDCMIGDNVHIAPGSIICGEVVLGDNILIGAGSTVINGISICSNTIIGAGSVVTKDITEPGTYVGAPARRIK